jgi:AraC-like DNA-binding protein
MPIDVAIRRPGARLAPYVERYVGYRLQGLPPGVHRGLPSRRPTFVLSLGPRVEMVDGPGCRPAAAPLQAFVAGLDTRPALLRHDGNHHGLAIELTPRGVRALLGVPARELAGRVVELAGLLGARASGLLERLAETDAWQNRFARLDEALVAGLSERHPMRPEVLHAWRLMTQGATDVDGLARAVGWSRRHFSESFHEEVGLPPRQLARVLRFERCCRLLRGPEPGTFAGVALAAGYFDQAHMLHEWRRLAGCTPAQWLREELLSLQDGDDEVAL